MEKSELPNIVGAGFFDSSVSFRCIHVSPKRMTANYEIEFFSDNSGTSHISDVAYKIRRGMVIVAKPGCVRYSELPVHSHFVHLSTSSPELCRILDSMPTSFMTEKSDRYIEMVRRITRIHLFNRNNEFLRMQSLLLQLIQELYEDSKEVADDRLSSVDMKNRIAINKAISYMDSHFKDKCPLEKVAQYVNFSPIYFHNLFKKSTGMTPYQYILNRRIRCAKEYLIMSDMIIEEIADSCGFESRSYFNYVFKKEMNITPNQYRKQAMEKLSP